MNRSPIAVLYDIHGNLAALEAVLQDAEGAGVTRYLLGGDYATFGPWPRETAELLEDLPAVARIRGNVERWLREAPEVPSSAIELVAAALSAARDALGPDLVARLYELPDEQSSTRFWSAMARLSPTSKVSPPNRSLMKSACLRGRRNARSFLVTVIDRSNARGRTALSW